MENGYGDCGCSKNKPQAGHLGYTNKTLNGGRFTSALAFRNLSYRTTTFSVWVSPPFCFCDKVDTIREVEFEAAYTGFRMLYLCAVHRIDAVVLEWTRTSHHPNVSVWDVACRDRFVGRRCAGAEEVTAAGVAGYVQRHVSLQGVALLQFLVVEDSVAPLARSLDVEYYRAFVRPVDAYRNILYRFRQVDSQHPVVGRDSLLSDLLSAHFIK